MLAFNFMIVCGLFEGNRPLQIVYRLFICKWKRSVQDIYRLFICIAVGDPIIKKERVRVPLAGFTPPHFVPVQSQVMLSNFISRGLSSVI